MNEFDDIRPYFDSEVSAVLARLSNNSEFIDRIRDSLIQNFSLNYIRNKLRIINIYNTGQKNFHRLYNISLGKKFTNGFIRNGHDVLEISDRDFIRQNRKVNFIFFIY